MKLRSVNGRPSVGVELNCSGHSEISDSNRTSRSSHLQHRITSHRVLAIVGKVARNISNRTKSSRVLTYLHAAFLRQDVSEKPWRLHRCDDRLSIWEHEVCMMLDQQRA